MTQSLNQKLSERISVKDFGALGDGVTDDSPYIQAALDGIDIYGTLYFPPGVYACNVVNRRRVNMLGAGPKSSILSRYVGGDCNLSLEDTVYNWRMASIENIGFGVVDPGTDGIGVRFGPESYAVNAEAIGRWSFRNCAFAAKVGVYIPYGNIGNEFHNCRFSCSHFGFYGYAALTGYTMYVGCNLFSKCHFDASHKAAFFMNSRQEGSQTSLQDCILESNEGFGVCVYENFTGRSPVLALDNCHMEGNATVGAIEIDVSDPLGTSYEASLGTPYDLYLRKSVARMENTPFISVCLVDGRLLADESSTGDGYGVLVADADSVCVIKNAGATTKVSPNLFIESLFNYTATASGYAALVRTKPRHIVSNGYSPDYAITFDGDAPNFGGSVNVTPTQVKDGILFGSCGEYAFVKTGADQDESVPARNLTANKYVVVSFDVKRVSGTGGTLVSAADTTLYGAVIIPAGYNRWFSFAAIIPTAALTDTVLPLGLLIPAGSGTITLRFSALQFLFFDTAQEALEFVRSGIYALPSAQPHIMRGADAPVAGTWVVGDLVYHDTPSSGGPIGWVCTSGPCTWKAWGTIA